MPVFVWLFLKLLKSEEKEGVLTLESRVLRLQNSHKMSSTKFPTLKRGETLLKRKDLHILKRLLPQQNMNIIRPF